jgi:hypothetical protein
MMKKLLPGWQLLIIFLLTGFMSAAQAPAWNWAQSAGGGSQDQARAVAADGLGNVYVAGEYANQIVFGTTTLVTAMSGVNGVFLVKYDAAGNLLWAEGNTLGSNNAGATALTVDAQGNAYITGYYRSSNITFDAFSLSNSAGGFSDAFLVKYDPNGNVLWAKKAGGQKDDMPEALAVDPSGNAIISGHSLSPVLTIGTATLGNTGGADAFLIKYDATGNLLWATSATGPGNELGKALSTDGGGNIYLTGSFIGASMAAGNLTLTSSSPNASDVFVAKYNPAGTALWANAGLGSSNADYAGDLDVDATGNVYATGFFYSNTLQFGASTLVKNGSFDLYLVKYDTNGNLLWAKNEGAPAQGARGRGLGHDAAGNIYLAGEFSGPGLLFDTLYLTSPNNLSTIDDDLFVVKYNSTGSALWGKSAAGPNTDVLNGLAMDGADNLYVAGSFWGSAAFDAFSVSVGNQNADMFAARLFSPLATGIDQVQHPVVLNIYPNPANEVLTVQSPERLKNMVCLDALGRVMDVKWDGNSIGISGLAKGWYSLQAITESGQCLNSRFIKQ